MPSDRIRHTIDLLIKRGPDAYKKFLETLIVTGNAHVAQQLDKDYCNSDECKQFVERESHSAVQVSAAVLSGLQSEPRQVTQLT